MVSGADGLISFAPLANYARIRGACHPGEAIASGATVRSRPCACICTYGRVGRPRVSGPPAAAVVGGLGAPTRRPERDVPGRIQTVHDGRGEAPINALIASRDRLAGTQVRWGVEPAGRVTTTSTRHATGTSRGYRADLDGLRGVAVLMVIACHMGIPFASRGFIGVDVFFVLSGYLITSILAQEQTLAVLPHFYVRRLQRLMPALLAVMLVTTLMAALVLLPQDFTRLLKSAAAGLQFRANEYFADELGDYFAARARELPLLHTWSLSIEWQFYLVWPLVAVSLQRWVPQHGQTIATLVLLGGLLCVAALTPGDVTEYFHASQRLFELVMGALFARVDAASMGKTGSSGSAHRVRPSVATAAVIALVLLGVSLDASHPLGLLESLLVCTATGGLLLGGRGNSILEARWLVAVGRASYAAYLWHWPLLALAAYLQMTLDVFTGTVFLALVLGLALATERWIEAPGRRLDWGLARTVLLLWIVPMSLFRGAYLLSWHEGGLPQRLGGEAVAVAIRLAPWERLDPLGCTQDSAQGLLARCEFGGAAENGVVYVIGDSHAKNERWLAQTLTAGTDLHVSLRSYGGCLMLPGAYGSGASGDAGRHCAAATAAVWEEMARIRPDMVVLVQRWNGPYAAAGIASLEQALEAIASLGATPVVIGQAAQGVDMHACFNQPIKTHRLREGVCTIPRSLPANQVNAELLQSVLSSARSQVPQLIEVDLQSVQCTQESCIGEAGGLPLYDDDHHLNGFGAHYLAEAWVARHGSPLAAVRPRSIGNPLAAPGPRSIGNPLDQVAVTPQGKPLLN